MDRNQKSVYCFIYDDSRNFYRASQMPNGTWSVTKSSEMYPLRHNPKNLIDSPVEFGTNRKYFSMMRSINYPLEFIFDGCAILNERYLKGKGINESLYFAMFQFDSTDGIYRLAYNGRFDFQQKNMDEKLFIFKVPTVDDSAWGILSQNDDVEYAIDCSETNPKAIKVLIDNFTLISRYTYQDVASDFDNQGTGQWIAWPFVLVNQDGDSSGVIVKSQNSFPFTSTPMIKDSQAHFFETFYPITGMNIQGTFNFLFTLVNGNVPAFELYFISSLGSVPTTWIYQNLVTDNINKLVNGQSYSIDFNFNFNLAAGERLYLVFRQYAFSTRFVITPSITNTFISLNTKVEPAIVYALRPLDALQDLVRKATLGRYTMDSVFFQNNNNVVLIPGESIRGVKDSKLYLSFSGFFDTYDAINFMALRSINGALFMERADDIYREDTNLIDLGELIECTTEPASEYMANELEVGSPNQDYRHPSGRLEFNQTNIFSLPFINVKNKLSLVTKYRTDSYGIIFMLLDYRGGQSTQDNVGDKNVFAVAITDDFASAQQDIETFENVNVVNSPLAPIIKYPLTGSIIHNDKPFLKGIGIPGSTVNIYIEDVFDGTTTVDANGNWTYQVVASIPSYNPGVFDGVVNINATNTDMGGVLNTIQLIIDTTSVSAALLLYPTVAQTIWNNLPLIRGIAPPGTNINITIDGNLVASLVADNSCGWEYKVTTPLAQGAHLIDIGTSSFTQFFVNAFTAFPIITYIGSELDGFPIVNNLPLIRGVGIPGTVFNLYLNYNVYGTLGNGIVIDANGDWSFQVVPTTYIDPLTSATVTLAPIRNGLNVISTSLVNNLVKVSVSGYKLLRPPYDSITGVPDNTIFNTTLSPKRMLMNHKSMLSSIMDKQRNDFIRFEKAGKNSSFRTVLVTTVVEERADVSVGELGEPLARLEKVNARVIARKTYAQTLADFNNGGVVRATFKGNEIFMLPIGSMKMKSIMDDVQEWQLLVSNKTTYMQLLSLSRRGLTLDIMKNSIFHSDYNSLHMVAYNFQQPSKYNFKELYDDWFDHRNEAWLYGETKYIQKYSTSEVITDQIITNGISSAEFRLYRCSDAKLIDTIPYQPVNPIPIPAPEIVMEVQIDFSSYPEDQYFCVLAVGSTLVGIFERVETRANWPRTILIESTNSTNSPGVFYSTGFKTIIRVEGLIKKIQPEVATVIAQEESGDKTLLWQQLSKKRVIRFGTARGFPDYMAFKCSLAITNDSPLIEGTAYTIQEGEKIVPSDDIYGVPMYYYNVNMTFKENTQGKVFAGGPGADTSGVILVVDATAIGLPGHSLIDIIEQ